MLGIGLSRVLLNEVPKLATFSIVTKSVRLFPSHVLRFEFVESTSTGFDLNEIESYYKNEICLKNLWVFDLGLEIFRAPITEIVKSCQSMDMGKLASRPLGPTSILPCLCTLPSRRRRVTVTTNHFGSPRLTSETY